MTPEEWELVCTYKDGRSVVICTTILMPHGDNRFPKVVREIDSPMFCGGWIINVDVKEIVFRRTQR
jgi:hypothetical protein